MNARFPLVALVLGLVALPAAAQNYGVLPQPLDYSEPPQLFAPPAGSAPAPLYSQNTTVYSPPAPQYAQPPAVYQPVQAAPLYGSVTTSGLTAAYQPAPVYQPAAVYQPAPAYQPAAAYQPMTAYQPLNYAAQPAAMAPVCCHRPAAPYAPPVITYRPVVQASYLQPTAPSTTYVSYNTYAPVGAPGPTITGPRVYAKTKYYVEGQPIRNFLKAITP